jgi:hypothetical protein
MAFYPFVDENTAAGLTPGTNAPQQAGISNIYPGTRPEVGIGVPWVVDPEFSWLDYQCSLEVFLDAGQALHKCLPQQVSPVDDLGGVDVMNYNQAARSVTGVNLASLSKGADVIQAMATSTYTFRLRGFARRAGYQIPIPKLLTVAGVAATPAQQQWAVNDLIGNMMGVPIWLARWDKWYYVSLPPKTAQPSPPNLAEHITGTVKPPNQMQVPVGGPDQNSILGGRQPLSGFSQITGGQNG